MYICRCTVRWGTGKSCHSCRCIRDLSCCVSCKLGQGSTGDLLVPMLKTRLLLRRGVEISVEMGFGAFCWRWSS